MWGKFNRIETVKHLFWECHQSQLFWSQLKTFLLGLGIVIELNYKLICFGNLNVPLKQHLLNFIIISANYFIFRNKYTKTIPNFQEYKTFLYRRIEIEKYIALDKDKLEQHRLKWRAFFKIKTNNQSALLFFPLYHVSAWVLYSFFLSCCIFLSIHFYFY